jgi:GNAT superfamily N-acetyltransferase
MTHVPAGYEIGAPQSDELAALPAIEVAAARVFPPRRLPAGAGDPMLALAFYEEVARSKRLWVARCLEPRTPVGFAAATLLDGSAHLHELDVLPDHARRGLGRALVQEVTDWAQASGFAGVTLTTFRDLRWNAPFYASLGFEQLPVAALGPELGNALREEVERGLDPELRVAMRLDLGVRATTPLT